MKTKISFVAFVTLLIINLFAGPALAQLNHTTLADIREQVNGIFVQLHTFDNLCVVILSAQLKEVDIDILEIRKLVTIDKGNLAELIENFTRSDLLNMERAVDTIIQCATLLGGGLIPDADPALRIIPAAPNDPCNGISLGSEGAIINEVQDVLCKVEAHNVALGLDDRKFTKIASLLNNVLAHLLSIRNLLVGSVSGLTASCSKDSLLAQAECIISFIESVASLVDSISTSDASQRAIPQLTQKGVFPLEILRSIKISCGLAHQDVYRMLRDVKRITTFKKWAFKGLREVKELLRASNFGGRAANDLLTPLTNYATHVFTLNGQLIALYTNGLNTNVLANGIYLTVTDAAEKVSVKKVIVKR